MTIFQVFGLVEFFVVEILAKKTYGVYAGGNIRINAKSMFLYDFWVFEFFERFMWSHSGFLFRKKFKNQVLGKIFVQCSFAGPFDK